MKKHTPPNFMGILNKAIEQPIQKVKEPINYKVEIIDEIDFLMYWTGVFRRNDTNTVFCIKAKERVEKLTKLI